MIWLWLAVAALLGLDGLRMRARIGAIAVLAPSDEPVSPSHRFIAAPGVTLDEATRRAVSAHARSARLEVVELVPASLPALGMWALLQFVDPASYRRDRLGRGVSAGHATLVDAGVLGRARVAESYADEAAFVAAACSLKHFAAGATDLAIAPGLPARPSDPKRRLAVLRAGIGGGAQLVLVAVPVILLVLVAGAATGGWQGLAALAAYQLQPLVALLGRRGTRPGDLLLTTLLRPLFDAWVWLRLLLEPIDLDRAADAERRARYDRLLAAGTEAFFEPRLDVCPICGAAGPRPLVRTRDVIQDKPGRFVLDRCASCGHIFQNPRLSLAGLDFYYGDFYDGLGAADAEALFSSAARHYVDRARIVSGVTEPRRWLDVGGGHGHFCCVARELLPTTRFDALDLSESIDEAVRRGWVDQGFRGLFPEQAPAIAGVYDVVSMSHYLEHTRDPAAELAAAATALAPGGLVMIEVPDPEFVMGRVLGRFWLPWFQPQHQHLLSVKNLTRLLADNGLEPVVWHRGPAHQPVDFWAGAFLVLSSLAPKPDVPWRPPHGRARRWWRTLVFTVGAPAIPVGRALDLLLRPLFERASVSNTYRVVARKTRRPAADAQA